MTYITTSMGYIVGHVRLERGISDKHHQRVDRCGRNIQQGFKNFNVLVVLVQWVLKLAGVLVDFLRPGFLVSGPKNPAFHVFGFDNEHAVARHNYVVDLCGAIVCL